MWYVQCIVLCCCALVISRPGSSIASDLENLQHTFEHIKDCPLDTLSTISLSACTLTHHDLKITFDSGRLAFTERILLDSAEVRCAAYFEGNGRFQFHPRVPTERDQLARFFETDSLNRPFDRVLLICDSTISRRLEALGQPTSACFGNDEQKRAKKEMEEIVDFSERYLVYSSLRGITSPGSPPYLLVNVEPEHSKRLYYCFDPHERKEIELYRHFSEPGSSGMELICSYSQYADEFYGNLNGFSRACYEIVHYDISASLDRAGNCRARTEVELEVLSPFQMTRLDLHNQLRVDSITTELPLPIAFERFEDKRLYRDWYPGLYLYFDRQLRKGEHFILTFHYEGGIARREIGEFFVTAGARWYPRAPYNTGATFDVRFKTPKDFEFVAAGTCLERDKVGDTLITHWEVKEPADNVSFAIGPMKKYEFADELIGSVDIYYSKELHRLIGRALTNSAVSTGRHMQKQVAEDVINSMRLFTHYFGPCPHEKLSVSEIIAYHGEAFPGFLHMGFNTWISTDAWGAQQLFRAHEVAHQWWGVGVGYETYHDQWLSEGFAEYCGLMYLQSIKGNDTFLDKLEEMRKEIFSVRKYIFGLSGEEAGPIIMGYRTSSSRTRGDFGLIIYKKGAFVLHMLRNLLLDLATMSDDLFFEMMRDFFATFQGRDATTRDFRRLTEKYMRMDMGWFFQQWVYGNELPTYKFEYETVNNENGHFDVHCTVRVENVSRDFIMYVPVEIEFEKDAKSYMRVVIEGDSTSFTIPDLPRQPRKIRLNPFESVLAEVKQ